MLRCFDCLLSLSINAKPRLMFREYKKYFLYYLYNFSFLLLIQTGIMSVSNKIVSIKFT